MTFKFPEFTHDQQFHQNRIQILSYFFCFIILIFYSWDKWRLSIGNQKKKNIECTIPWSSNDERIKLLSTLFMYIHSFFHTNMTQYNNLFVIDWFFFLRVFFSSFSIVHLFHFVLFPFITEDEILENGIRLVNFLLLRFSAKISRLMFRCSFSVLVDGFFCAFWCPLHVLVSS